MQNESFNKRQVNVVFLQALFHGQDYFKQFNITTFNIQTFQLTFFFRWNFTPLEEAKRFQHDIVYRYLAKCVEDNYPLELEKILKEREEMMKHKEQLKND